MKHLNSRCRTSWFPLEHGARSWALRNGYWNVNVAHDAAHGARHIPCGKRVSHESLLFHNLFSLAAVSTLPTVRMLPTRSDIFRGNLTLPILITPIDLTLPHIMSHTLSLILSTSTPTRNYFHTCKGEIAIKPLLLYLFIYPTYKEMIRGAGPGFGSNCRRYYFMTNNETRVLGFL